MTTRFLPLLIAGWWLAFFWVLGWKPDLAYNAHRYFEWLLLGSLLLAGLILPVRLVLPEASKWLLRLLLLAMLCVALVAANHWLALRYLLEYLVLFCCVLTVAKVRIATGAAFDRAAMLGVLLFAAGASIMVLEGWLLSLLAGLLNRDIIFGAFVNVRFLAGLQFASLLLLPAAGDFFPSRRARWLILVVAACWWGWLLFSGTRALVVLPVAVLLACGVAGRQSRAWLRQLGKQFVGGLLVFGFLRGSSAWIVSGVPTDDALLLARTGTSGRFAHWQEAWQHFLAHPWFGNGPGSYACFTDRLEATPHNLPLMLLSEWGGLVTALVVGMGLLVIIAMAHRLRRQAGLLSLSLFATLLTVAAAEQLQGVSVNPLSQMLLVLVLGWSWAVFAPEQFVPAKMGKPESRRLTLHAVIAVLALGFWLGMAKVDLALQHTLLHLPDGTIILSNGPRYWLDGHDHCGGWYDKRISGWLLLKE